MPNYVMFNIKMVKGDTESFGFEIEGIENLDAAYFSCKRNSQDENYLFQKFLNSGITQRTANQYVVRIEPDDTALLEPGQYWYDLEISKDDDVFTIFRGVLELLPEITTPNSSPEANLIDLIYPVGSYYWSSNSTSPEILFGVGTWTQITEKFIFAAGANYVSGDTGGEATHTLTVSEMPSHNHRCITDESLNVYGGPFESNDGPASGHGYAYPFYYSFTGTKGGGKAHNNIPPYIVRVLLA